MSQPLNKAGSYKIEDKYISLIFIGRDRSTSGWEEIIEIANKEYEPCVIYADMQIILKERMVQPYGYGTIWIWNLDKDLINVLNKCRVVKITSGDSLIGDKINLGTYKIVNRGLNFKAKSGGDIPFEITIENIGNFILRTERIPKSGEELIVDGTILDIIKKTVKDNSSIYSDYTPVVVESDSAKCKTKRLKKKYVPIKSRLDYIDQWSNLYRPLVRDEYYINRRHFVIKEKLTDVITGYDRVAVEIDDDSSYNRGINTMSIETVVPTDIEIRKGYADSSLEVRLFEFRCDENKLFIVGNRISYVVTDGNPIEGIIIGVDHEVEINTKQFATAYVMFNEYFNREIKFTEQYSGSHKIGDFNLGNDTRSWLFGRLLLLDRLFRNVEGMKLYAGLLLESTNPILNFNVEYPENTTSTELLKGSIIEESNDKKTEVLMTSVWAGEGYGLVFPHFKGEYGIIMPIGGIESSEIVGLYYWLDKKGWLPKYNAGDILLHLKDDKGQLLFSQDGEFVIEASSLRIRAQSNGTFSMRPSRAPSGKIVFSVEGGRTIIIDTTHVDVT